MSDRQLTARPKRVSFLLKFAFGFLFNSFSYECADYLGRASYTFEFGSVVLVGTVFGIAWVLFGRFAERSPLCAVLIGAVMPLAVPLLTIVGAMGIYQGQRTIKSLPAKDLLKDVGIISRHFHASNNTFTLLLTSF